MTKFKFQLEPVLQHRETKEQQAVLAQTMAHREYINCLDNLNQTKDQLEDSIRSHTQQDYFDVVNSLMYRQLLKIRITEQKGKADTARRDFELCRKNTVEARKQKLIIEKLKQNKYLQHVREANRLEQKLIDEMAGQLAMRSSQLLMTLEGGDR